MDRRWTVFWLLVFVVSPGRGQTRVVASPMRSMAPRLRFPRVSGMRDEVVQRRVNAILANREREDIGTLSGCRRPIVGPRVKDSDSETVRVAYLSSSFLSIDVRRTVWQCAPYPQIDIPEPITLDLRSGREVDWAQFFAPGFLPVRDFSMPVKPRSGPPSRLTTLYLGGYKGHDAECLDAVKGDSLYGFDLWFDRRQAALVAVPDFPHVIRACAEEVAIPLSAVLPYVSDEAAARELAR